MNKHTEFRRTKVWKKFREKMLKKVDNTCELCGTIYSGKRTRQLQVHHLFPEKYELLEEVFFKVICSSCHDLIERFIRKKSWGQYSKSWHELLDKFIKREIIF